VRCDRCCRSSSPLSAWLRAGRFPEPAKITASMSAARSDLCEVSPIAQRNASDQVRLAAAVRTDHAGQSRFDHEVRWFNERLEAMKAKTREFHTRFLSWPDSLGETRESPCRDNTIEGDVGVADESLQASRIGRDNGFAGAGGQPAAAAFPKGFIEVREALTQVAHANDQTLASPRRRLSRKPDSGPKSLQGGIPAARKPVSSSTAG